MAAKKKRTPEATPTISYKKFILWFWLLFFAGLLFIASLFLLAGFGAFGDMPRFEELENPESNLATEIISSDGKTIGTFFNENRTPVTFEELPPHLV